MRTGTLARLTLPLLGGLFLGGTLPAQTPVPSTVVQIRGNADTDDGVTMSYQAYQNPGTPYRILCPSPCTADQNAIYGLYAGFAQARQQVVSLMGVDSLPVNQPFDLHVTDDHWCGTASDEFAGDSGQYPSYSMTTGTFGCFWFTAPGRFFLPFQYPDTSTLPYQILTSHEFTHTVFFTRQVLSWEDFAKAVSFYVSGFEGGPTITDPCDSNLNTVFAGKLIWDMCQRSGFQWSDLAPAMKSIDATYLSNGGTAGYFNSNSPTSAYQFRKALAVSIGSDTLDSFLASKEQDQVFMGDDGVFTASQGRLAALSGWASFLLPANAVASNQSFHIEVPYVLPASMSSTFSFANAFRISKPDYTDFNFQHPVYFQFKYEPDSLPAGADASTLQLYHYDGTNFTAVSGSRVDPQRMTISAPITQSGFYVAGSGTTTAAPTLVIPRAVTGSNIRTQVVLFNASILQPATGQLVYHPEGVAASPSDPTIPYSLGVITGKSAVFPDILASFGVTGPGTIDVIEATGYLPDVSVRQVDTSADGFPGTYVETCPAVGALKTGDDALLMAPANSAQEQARFLVRTFASGVSMTVTARNPSGTVVATTSLTYPANTSSRVLPKTFANGHAVAAGETFEVKITAGSAILVNETGATDTSAHNFEYAVRVDTKASGPLDFLHLPKVVEASGPDGSTIRTGLEWVNASNSTIKGGVLFHPGDGSPNVTRSYSLAPWQAGATGDIVAAFGESNKTGSFVVQSTVGNLPTAFGRLIHAGNSTPFEISFQPFFGALDLPQAGDRLSLVVPDDLSAEDFRIGIRTIAEELDLTIVIYDSSGEYLKQVTKTIPAATSSETSAATFLGQTLSGGEILQILVDGGHGYVYGSGVSNTTGAANYQPARRQPYNY